MAPLEFSPAPAELLAARMYSTRSPFTLPHFKQLSSKCTPTHTHARMHTHTLSQTSKQDFISFGVLVTSNTLVKAGQILSLRMWSHSMDCIYLHVAEIWSCQPSETVSILNDLQPTCSIVFFNKQNKDRASGSQQVGTVLVCSSVPKC